MIDIALLATPSSVSHIGDLLVATVTQACWIRESVLLDVDNRAFGGEIVRGV